MRVRVCVLGTMFLRREEGGGRRETGDFFANLRLFFLHVNVY